MSTATDVSRDFDYVIVGAGSAGCVLANRLTEDGTTRVLLLEAGGVDASPYIHIPAGLMLLAEKYDWRYEALPDASRSNAVDKWSGGKVLGGSSSINGMLWVRGNAADFDSWARAGCTDWDYAHVLPYFIRSETYERPGSPYRGTNGPQPVSHVRAIHPLTEAFIAGAVESGYAFNPDYNGAVQGGVAHSQVSQRNGLRQSAARAYLWPARRRRNLSVVTRAQVQRVEVDDGRATGVEYIHRGQRTTARASREVVLSAGALATPKLLMLSGIGPAEELRQHGISVVVDLPEVGRNLQEHPYALLSWHVDLPTLNVEIKPKDFLKHGFDYLAHHQGPGASPVTHAVLFTEPDPTTGQPTFQGSFSPLAFGQPAAGAVTRNRGGRPVHDVHDLQLHNRPAVNVLPCVLHPEGRGEVTIRSNDPADPIVIRHEVVGRESDLARLVEACRMYREIMSAPSIAKHVLDERAPGPDVDTDDEWRGWLHAASWRGEHPVGTCRMGSDAAAVVDPQLRVNGVESLRVIDASIFPTLTSGNTNAPAIMVGEKGSDLILGRTLAPSSLRAESEANESRVLG